MTIKNSIKNFLSKRGYSITGTKYIPRQLVENRNLLQLEFDHVLSRYLLGLDNPSHFNFIQVGAFDGIECDPLRKYLLKYDWKGTMMEPQPMPFKKLSAEYQNRSNLQILNAAISRDAGKAELFILEGDSLPEWSKGMASFNKENILKHSYLIPSLEKFVKKIEIQTTTFEQILNAHQMTKLDLLQVDTEGFDAEVIRMFPFNITKPSIIHFESKHIKKADLEKLLDMLIKYGYSVAKDREEDMMAVLPEQVK